MTTTQYRVRESGAAGSSRAHTARGCERARMRCPWTVGIVVGREECARSDLRFFVTYSQILPYWGCGYSDLSLSCRDPTELKRKYKYVLITVICIGVP